MRTCPMQYTMVFACASSSRHWVITAWISSTSCLGIILCSSGQHSHVGCMWAHTPPSGHQKCLHQGLTCGTIPSPSVTQDRPVAASAMHVVRSMHKLLSTSPSYFLLSPMATIAQSPCWLGWEGRMWDGWWKTSATLTKGGMPVAELWLLSHLSVGGAGARIQSVHHHTNTDSHTSRPLGICLGLCIVHLPQPLLQHLQLLGRQCPWPQFFLRSRSGVVQG